MKGKDTDKAQLHTLEGFTAGFLVLFALLFSLQAIAITPTSSSTASQEVELHNYEMVDDILSKSKATGELRDAVLSWQNASVGFNNSTEGLQYYAGRGSVDRMGEFGDSLQILDERGIAYNVYIRCDGGRYDFVRNGQESLHSVTATVTLNLYDEEVTAGGQRLENTDYLGNGACGNIDENSDLYNTVEVKISAWRM
jgi:hypothetical protein